MAEAGSPTELGIGIAEREVMYEFERVDAQANGFARFAMRADILALVFQFGSRHYIAPTTRRTDDRSNGLPDRDSIPAAASRREMSA